MNYDFNFQTDVWFGDFSYGPFNARNWYSIGGPEHPLFKTLVSRIESEVPEMKHFKTYVNGGLLEDWMSWDIDITITGDYEPELIKTVFSKVHIISFDMHLWVDIRYQEKMWRPDLMTPDNLNEMDAWCYEEFNNFSRNGEYVFNEQLEQIDGLYRAFHTYPADKHIDKLNEGYIYQPPLELFT